MQMNNTAAQFELMEANLRHLGARIPNLPATGIILCRVLQHIGREMASMFEQQLKPFGLTEAEFRVLTALFSQPDGVAHPSDLGVKASQSPANMSRISDALVERGLITRDLSVHDRRKMVLRITDEGGQFVRGLLPKLFVPLHEMLKDFSQAEQRHLTEQLKRLAIELEQAAAAAAAVAEPAV